MTSERHREFSVEEAVMFDAWGGGIRDLSERGVRREDVFLY